MHDNLDHGLVLVGQTADQAMATAAETRARAERFEEATLATLAAAGYDATDPGQASFADPLALRFA